MSQTAQWAVGCILLTKRHFAILQAALQFFDEELSPHGQHAMQHYFKEPLTEDLKTGEIRELRDFLQGRELRYISCDATATRLIDQRLSATIEDARSAMAGRPSQVAIVLIPSTV